MLCSVIIVTYDGAKWIDKCLGSLIYSTIPLEVIVVDNGSSDGTPQKIRQGYPNVEIIETHKNLGFGKANNIGIKKAYEAGAEHIFLLNQDAWVEPDTIEKLIKTAERFPDYGIISPLHLNGDGSALDYGFINYLCGSRIKNHISDIYIKPKAEHAEIYPLDFVNAAFWLLPRKTIEIVGGFNPLFFQYGEDQDYVNRCHYFNLKVGIVPSAKAYHGRIQYDNETKQNTVLRTTVLAKLLNPQDVTNLNVHIKYLVKLTIKCFLLFRFRQVRYLLNELAYYLSNKTKIKVISIKLKIAGLTFLE
jgi:GT2 family glycosyltransferase